MPKIKKIKPVKPRGRFAIVAARFNTEIVEGLLLGALKALNKHGVPEKSIDIVRVPGSLELALAAQCLGAVIQGDTDHYDYVCTGTVNGITQAGLSTGVPTIFGVLTCRKMKHARE